MIHNTLVRVLVVDDEPAIRISLAQYLDDLDFETVVASSAEEALLLLSKQPCDAAIVDIRLPGMDGEALILKAHEMYSDMCFLIYTGSVDFCLSKGLSAIGISACRVFRKPLKDLSLISEALLQILENKREKA